MYFISKDNRKEGPFTIEELRGKRLTDDMLAWKEGITNWCKISEIPELKDMVITTPPPLPHEIQNEARKKTFKIKKEKAKSIIIVCLAYGAVAAAFIAYFINEASYESNWPDKYPIYHTYAERNNHLLSYFPIFLGWLLVSEVVALIVAGIRISMLKPSEKAGSPIEGTSTILYKTDKGLISIWQCNPSEISLNDTVMVGPVSAGTGRYKMTEDKNYDSIVVVDGFVSSIQRKGT